MRVFRSLSIGVIAMAVCLMAGAQEVPYSKQAFDQALKQRHSVAVEFFADWCPTCRAQKPVLSAVLAEPRMKNLTLFVADFDTETALERILRVQYQSTLVVFRDGKEVGRSVGQTDREEIESLLNKAL